MVTTSETKILFNLANRGDVLFPAFMIASELVGDDFDCVIFW